MTIFHIAFDTYYKIGILVLKYTENYSSAFLLYRRIEEVRIREIAKCSEVKK
jgi:hypothetical protein